tara:strand:+ start:460 stop:855 length:396 start_codon:yes stop_codon:yes gene_type:complete
MNGETNLDILLKNMQPVLHEDIYVFHSSNISFNEAVQFNPILIFREVEGTALIIQKETAKKHALDYTYPSKMITLNIHSSLNAIGFLAAITRKLADNNISVNSISAHYHDHLFVPEEKAKLAIKVLEEFAE